MFTVTVTDEFCAAHALTIAGVRETTHGHNWHVRLVVAGPTLNDAGLLVDFHALERQLADTLDPFRNADLNSTPPFDRLNPSAEHVARYIAQAMTDRLPHASPAPGAHIASAAVTEAPGCEAAYAPPANGGSP